MVVLVLLALLVGAAFGAWCAWPQPRPTEEPPPAPLPPPFEPPPPPSGLYGRFLPRGQQIATALEETPLGPEQMAELLAVYAADHWQLGVTEMRAELVTSSGLTPALADHLATLALIAMEARHAQQAQPGR